MAFDAYRVVSPPSSSPIHPPRPVVVNPIHLKLMQIKNPGQACAHRERIAPAI